MQLLSKSENSFDYSISFALWYILYNQFVSLHITAWFLTSCLKSSLFLSLYLIIFSVASSKIFFLSLFLSTSLRSDVEKAMAPHSSTLVWKIPWMEEPGRLQSMGSLRVGHDWVISLSLFTFMHWRRKWQPTPVFLPGESQGQRGLVGCRLWGRTESDTTEAT